jgi:broad specificity phosphatase PhoE
MAQPLFILTRHGRTAGNEKNIYRGWSNADFAQLDENGQQDARDAGIYLKGLGLEFAAILVDDLARTQETAKIIAEILGVTEILTDKRLRPVNVGDFTGKSKAAYPLEEYMDNPKKKIPGGESLAEFNKRQAKVFADVLELIAQLKKMVLVVGHGSNTSFLYHNVNKGGKEVGYEGMTEPGGIMTFDKSGLFPIFKKRDPNKTRGFTLPPNHVPGMRVPKGGSSCSVCEYLGDDKKTCKQKDFIAWDGGKFKPAGSNVIPTPPDEFCSDWFNWPGSEEKTEE